MMLIKTNQKYSVKKVNQNYWEVYRHLKNIDNSTTEMRRAQIKSQHKKENRNHTRNTDIWG